MTKKTIAAIRPLKKLALAAALAMSALVAGAYGEKTVAHDTSGCTPGVWTSDFDAALKYAQENNVPLLSYWGSESCGYCGRMKRRGINTAVFESWVKAHPIVLVFTDASDTATETDVKVFTRGTNKTGLFPYMRIYWLKSSGTEVSACFSGRKGKMLGKGSNEAEQLIASLESVIGDWSPSCTVTYNANGGTVTPATATVAKGAAVGTLPTPTRANYNFLGWYTAATGGTKIAATTVVSANVTYYAQWEYALCTVTYNANGGTVTPATATVKKGAAVGTLPTPTRANYNFLGWYTAATGGTKIAATTVVSANVTYYAQWEYALCTVTYNANGGTVTPATATVKKGAAVGTLPTPTRANYNFLGWYTAATGGTKIAATTVVSANVTYYAQWELAVFTVTFDGNGGLIGESSRSVRTGAAVGTLPEAARNGYTFSGWFTAATGGTPVTAATVVTGNVTYYAQWVAGSWNYKTTSAGVTIMKAESATGAVTVPSSIGGKSVVAINQFAFFNASGMTSVTIPASVKTIGLKAFKGCTGLKSITLPASLTSLGSSAFSGCTGLTAVAIPSGVTTIPSSAFEGCTALASVTIPAGVTKVGVSAFANCPALAAVSLPGVMEIGNFAFFGDSALKSVSMPVVVTVGEKAFKNCTALASVSLPETLLALGKAAFFNSGLTSVTVPGSVEEIEDYTFQKCAALKAVILNEGVAAIASNVFANDEALVSVILPDTLESIDAFAFFRCAALKAIDLPADLFYIGEKAFKRCSSLEELSLPDAIVDIPAEMCNYCTSLVVVDSAELESVGLGAFGNCPALEDVTGLDDDAFALVKRGYAWPR